MIFVALAGLGCGGFKAMGRRAYCLRMAREFAFGIELNEARLGPLEQEAGATRDPLNALIKREQAGRARAEAKRCEDALGRYTSVADHPWRALPVGVPLPEYAPDRTRRRGP